MPVQDEEEPQLGPGPNATESQDGPPAPNARLHALQKLDSIPGTSSSPSVPAREPDARSEVSWAGSRPEAPGAPQSRARFSERESRESQQQDDGNEPSHRSIFRAATLNMGFLPRIRRRNTGGRSFWEPARRSPKALQWNLAQSIPLKDLMPLLKGVERSFFQKLDMELDKVESFYVEREKEMTTRYVHPLTDSHGLIGKFTDEFRVGQQIGRAHV